LNPDISFIFYCGGEHAGQVHSSRLAAGLARQLNKWIYPLHAEGFPQLPMGSFN